MELVDLYDKNYQKLNKIIERGSKLPEDTYRVAVHICIFNKDGQMLIQQRQSSKKEWAGFWDLSAGGAVTAGENIEHAIKRELKEELGIDISNENLRPHLTIHFNQGFNHIYIIEKDLDLSDVKIRNEEVKDVKWANKNELLEMIDKKEFIAYHHGFIELLFFMRKERGVRINKQ